jgi:hypothetical protein
MKTRTEYTSRYANDPADYAWACSQWDGAYPSGRPLRADGAFSLIEKGGRFLVLGGPQDQVLCDQPDRKTAEEVYEEFTRRAAAARDRMHRGSLLGK